MLRIVIALLLLAGSITFATAQSLALAPGTKVIACQELSNTQALVKTAQVKGFEAVTAEYEKFNAQVARNEPLCGILIIEKDDFVVVAEPYADAQLSPGYLLDGYVARVLRVDGRIYFATVTHTARPIPKLPQGRTRSAWLH